MKKIVLYISIIVDIFSILLITMYFNNTSLTFDKIFYGLLIFFFVVHIFDKKRQYYMKSNLESKILNNYSDKLYILIVSLILIFDIVFLVLITRDIYFPNLINLIIIIYLFSIKNYDAKRVYFNKEIAVFTNKKVYLKDIKEIQISKGFISKKISVYYVNRDPQFFNFFLESNMQSLYSFLSTYTRKKK